MRWTCCGAGRGAGLPRAASSSEVEDSRVDSFTALAVVTAFIAGAIASVAGFGIGSVLTPVLATRLDVRLAIAAVSLPHLAGTIVRFLLVRTHIDRDVLFGFGAASAIGGAPCGGPRRVWPGPPPARLFPAPCLLPRARHPPRLPRGPASPGPCPARSRR